MDINSTMKYQAIIFDFGNVIINIDVSLTFKKFAEFSGKSKLQIAEIISKNQLFRRYESGELNDAEFRDLVRQIIGFPFSDEQVDEAWNALLLDIPEERIELLKNLKKNYPIYLLSNTNAIHIKKANQYIAEKFGIKGIDNLFDECFLSYQMKLWKPDHLIYQSVLAKIDRKPNEVLFLDDNEANINAAKSLGMQTVLIEAPFSIIEHFKA